MKKSLLGTIIVLLVLLVVGCSSTPDNTEAITALDLEIVAIREKCVQMGFDSSDSSEWKNAEDSYSNAKKAIDAKQEDVLSLLGQTLDKYQAIYDSGCESLESSLKEKLVATRNATIASGAESLFLTELSNIDASTLKAFSLENVQNSNFAEAISSASLVDFKNVPATESKKALEFYNTQTNAYSALGILAEAFPIKSKITENDFFSYDEANWKLAEESYKTALNSLETDSQLACEKATLAKNSYHTVLTTAFTTLCSQAETHLLEQKKACDELKASVAMKEEYATANDAYSKAKESRGVGFIEKAYNEMTEAGAQFQFVKEQTALKREAAQKAILAAKESQAQTSEFAKQADLIAPLAGDDEPEFELPADGNESEVTTELSETEIQAESEAKNNEPNEVATDSEETEAARDTRLFLESIEGDRK